MSNPVNQLEFGEDPGERFYRAEIEASRPDGHDPLKYYMRDMGPYKPMSREEQEAVAMRIEEGRRKMLEGLCEIPSAIEVIRDWYSDISEGAFQPNKVLEISSGALAQLPSVDIGDEIVSRKTGSNTDLASEDETESADGRKIKTASNLIAAKCNEYLEEYSKAYGDITSRKAALVDLILSLRPKDRQLEDLAQQLNGASNVKKKIRRYVQQGQQEIAKAKEELFASNMRFVIFLAKSGKYVGRGLQLPDLIQEGNIGLLTAIDKYDRKGGAKLTTYAAYWIEQAIERALFDKGNTIRVPVHLREKANKLGRIKQKFLDEAGREPTIQELAEKLEVSATTVERMLAIPKEPASFETPIGQDEDGRLEDFIADRKAESPETHSIKADLRLQIEAALTELTPKEADIIRMRFGIGMATDHTLEEVGHKYDVTRERIRQIEAKALNVLLQRATNLRSYVKQDVLEAALAQSEPLPEKSENGQAKRGRKPTPLRVLPALAKMPELVAAFKKIGISTVPDLANALVIKGYAETTAPAAVRRFSGENILDRKTNVLTPLANTFAEIAEVPVAQLYAKQIVKLGKTLPFCAALREAGMLMTKPTKADGEQRIDLSEQSPARILLNELWIQKGKVGHKSVFYALPANTNAADGADGAVVFRYAEKIQPILKGQKSASWEEFATLIPTLEKMPDMDVRIDMSAGSPNRKILEELWSQKGNPGSKAIFKAWLAGNRKTKRAEGMNISRKLVFIIEDTLTQGTQKSMRQSEFDMTIAALKRMPNKKPRIKEAFVDIRRRSKNQKLLSRLRNAAGNPSIKAMYALIPDEAKHPDANGHVVFGSMANFQDIWNGRQYTMRVSAFNTVVTALEAEVARVKSKKAAPAQPSNTNQKADAQPEQEVVDFKKYAAHIASKYAKKVRSNESLEAMGKFWSEHDRLYTNEARVDLHEGSPGRKLLDELLIQKGNPGAKLIFKALPTSAKQKTSSGNALFSSHNIFDEIVEREQKSLRRAQFEMLTCTLMQLPNPEQLEPRVDLREDSSDRKLLEALWKQRGRPSYKAIWGMLPPEAKEPDRDGNTLFTVAAVIQNVFRGRYKSLKRLQFEALIAVLQPPETPQKAAPQAAPVVISPVTAEKELPGKNVVAGQLDPDLLSQLPESLIERIASSVAEKLGGRLPTSIPSQTVEPTSSTVELITQVEQQKPSGSSAQMLTLASASTEGIRNNELAHDYERQVEDALALAIEHEGRAKQAEDKTTRLAVEVERLKQEVGRLRANKAWQAASTETVYPIPKTLEDISEWTKTHFPDHLELTNRAIRMAEKSSYANVPLVYQALVLLATKYHDVVFGNNPEAREGYNEELKRLNLVNEKVCTDNRRQKFPDIYYVQREEGKRLLERHLKHGKGFDERYCLRIYFFADEAKKRIVVGHLPGHLPNLMT